MVPIMSRRMLGEVSNRDYSDAIVILVGPAHLLLFSIFVAFVISTIGLARSVHLPVEFMHGRIPPEYPR